MNYRDKIDKPWCIKLEMTHGCNLSCKFCPVHYNEDLRDPDSRGFMTPDTVATICRQLLDGGLVGRIELTLRGEPSLNPYILENLEIMRRILPKVQITMFSNGVVFFKDPMLAMKMLHSGLNVLCVDCYNNTYDRFMKLFDGLYENGHEFDLVEFESGEFYPYKKHSSGHRLRVVVLIPDLAEGDVSVRKIHNVAGNVPESALIQIRGVYDGGKLPLEKKCVRPFRELIVHYDGNVVICCVDWHDKVVMGNVHDTALEDIWYGELHWKILKSLYNKDRTGALCDVCDYHGGFRVGFLKDPR